MTRVETFVFADDGRVPNSVLPLLLRRGVIAPDDGDPAAAFERAFAANGWTGSWRDGIFDYHHYHSTAHEVLGIGAGSARVRFGGEAGATVAVATGDIVAIPAGVAHCLVSGSRDLLVVGAYADGRDWDLVRDPAAIAGARERIARVPRPRIDPVDGPSGPLVRLWSADNRAAHRARLGARVTTVRRSHELA